MSTYTSEPGTLLAGRYRLVDQTSVGAGWAFWKATDEPLARSRHRAHVRVRLPEDHRGHHRRPRREQARRPAFLSGVRRRGRRRARLRGAGVGGRRVTAGHAGRRPPGRPERRVAAVRGGPGHRGGARWRAGPPAAEPGVPALDARQRGQDHRPGHRRGAGRPDAGRGRKWAERRRWARRRTGPRAHRHPGPGPAAVRRADRLLARLAGTGRAGRRRGADRPPGRRSPGLGPGCPRRRRRTGCRAPRARCPRPSRPTSTP